MIFLDCDAKAAQNVINYPGIETLQFVSSVAFKGSLLQKTILTKRSLG